MILASSMLGIATILALAVFCSNLNNDGIVRFPFVLSTAFLALVIPQAAALLLSDHYLAVAYRDSGTATTICYLILSCMFAGLAGHVAGVRKGPPLSSAQRTKPTVDVQYRAALAMATILMVVSVICILWLSSLGGGLEKFFVERGNYAIEWTGLPVYLGIGVRLIYPALFFAFMANSHRSTLISKALIAIGILYPLAQIIFLNRRSDVVFFGMAVLIATYYYSRIRIPRLAVIAGVVIGIGVITFQTDFRSRTGDGLDRYRGGISISAKIDDILTFERNTEIAAAAYTVDNTRNYGGYQFGAIFWDAQVQQWIPATILGTEFKNGLRITPAARDSGDRYAAWDRGQFFYIAAFGISDTFQQFGYLGFLFFGAMGYLFGRWEAGARISPAHVYLLAIYMPFVALAVGHGIKPALVRWPVDLAVMASYYFLVRQWTRAAQRHRRTRPAYQ